VTREVDFLCRRQQRRLADLAQVEMKRSVAVVGTAPGFNRLRFDRNPGPPRRQFRQEGGFHPGRFDQALSPSPDQEGRTVSLFGAHRFSLSTSRFIAKTTVVIGSVFISLTAEGGSSFHRGAQRELQHSDGRHRERELADQSEQPSPIG